ncbi:T9SS type A sorting domain-containing protein [Winogradskyella sp. SYSU M77433]|uniref:T9SS type A sorting domain-containing protein n=1 Tax=Winogradskyella sp. SYSU M77433 TaxID=3042722 RepID=UPI002480F30D|nr:T9SS type A sorting domain-containing protein [Winogradskyella sp. SYSU M77433]MDH7911267.1 T9SS type A sorting domain-containing protein [Winogradskyella sp. SYSU M77433]
MKQNDILKKSKVFFYLFALCLLASFAKSKTNNVSEFYFFTTGDYVALTISSGFNEDVIAETGDLAGTTTASVDKATDDYCYIAYNVGITYGLPTNGELNNGNIPYQLADYTSNNALRLIGPTNSLAGAGGLEEGRPTSGSVTFLENENIETIYLAVTSGSGTSSVSGNIIFDDNSTQAFTVSIPDWYANSATIIANNLGRGRRSDNSLSGAPSGGPYIFEIPIDVDVANQTKLVTGMDFQNDATGDSVFNLFAVSAKKVPYCDAPTDLSAEIGPVTTTLSWVDTVSTSWEITVQPEGSGLPSGSGETVSATTYDANTNIGVTQEFYVRALCPDNVNFSPWAGPFVFGDYKPLELTGLNADVIANGVGDASVSAPQDIDGTGYAYLSEDFKVQETDADLSFGLPANGVLPSPNTDGLEYNFASYDANNSLRIETAGVEETITLPAGYPSEKIYLLTTSGSGSASISGDINFSDNTSQSFTSVTVPDWYYSTALPVAISGIGRVSTFDNVIQNPFNNPRIYELELSIDNANQTKTITSIDITKDSGGVVNIFAITSKMSGESLSVTDQNNLSLNIYPNPVKNNLYIEGVNVYDISMYNILGERIDVEFKEGKVDVSSLDSGMYLLKVSNDLGQSKTFKVLKK